MKKAEALKVQDVREEDGGITVTCEIISRDAKETWGRIFELDKYQITEWANPRKKKRGTIRRRRREKNVFV